MTTPEQEARARIDALLQSAGWSVQCASEANIHATRGAAIRDQSAGLPIGTHEVRPQGCGTRMCRNQFPLKSGYGFADYLLYVEGKAAGVIEAKKEGVTLSGVETQSAKYTKGLPDGLPAWRNPLPFAFQSTGAETRFTNGMDPEPRARPVFAFHRPETLSDWLEAGGSGFSPTNAKPAWTAELPMVADAKGVYGATPGATFLWRMRAMPPLHEQSLWPAQIEAIQNLEQSLRENRPRALIQMATGVKAWLASQPPLPQGEGRGEGGAGRFTAEQRKWLEMIRDHIAANLGIDAGDFEYAPFSQHVGLGKVHQLFGDKLNGSIEELNETLAA